MQRKRQEIDEIMDATGQLLSTMTRFLIALKKFQRSEPGRPSLRLLQATLQDGLKGMEQGLELDRVGTDDGGDSV